MYECPGCGQNLRFDIPSQMLKCTHCDSLYDPYQYNAGEDAKESVNFDVTVFTCPQCGGEIMSTDTSAAEFCSYCGGSTILSSRISKEHKPGYIIPFQKTKEDCKKAYHSMLKGAFFAPSELKDSAYIDSFRGIYMPYWLYHIEQHGPFTLKGEKSYRRGNYIYTDHYNLNGNINAYYKGMSYDASSTFDDRISLDIAPYDVRGMKEFTPAILSGFYADTSDVDCNIYIEDASEFANENSYRSVVSAFSGMTVKSPESNAGSLLHTRCEAIDSAMFPVWFMSYRNKDRVAYTIINGQTGEAVADLPVARRKYIICSLILAVPIFLLLGIFTMTPKFALALAMIMGGVVSAINYFELRAIVQKDSRSYDKGYLYKRGELDQYKTDTPAKKSRKTTASKTAPTLVFVIVAVVFMGMMSTIVSTIFSAGFFFIAAPILSLVFMCLSFKPYKKLDSSRGMPTFVLIFITVIIAALIALVNPVSDIYYYAATVLVLVSVILTNLGVINRHNVLSTRPLPQFNRKGGDDNA